MAFGKQCDMGQNCAIWKIFHIVLQNSAICLKNPMCDMAEIRAENGIRSQTLLESNFSDESDLDDDEFHLIDKFSNN